MRFPPAFAAAFLVAVLALSIASGPPATASSARQGEPDPAVLAWPEWPSEVSCGRGIPFDPIVAFSGPTNAERGPLMSEKALRRFLADEGLGRPHGWRKIVETGGVAEFAAGRLSRGPEWMSFRRTRKGWRFSGYSSRCEPSTLRRGQPAITWSLAPEQRLGPATRQVRVNLGPGECNGGKSQNDRVERPQFREQNGVLLMSLWLRPVGPGPHTCQGLVEPPLTITLPEPLGHRRLFDGGVYPPRPGDAPKR